MSKLALRRVGNNNNNNNRDIKNTEFKVNAQWRINQYEDIPLGRTVSEFRSQ